MIRKIPVVRQRRSSKFDQFFSKSLELKPVAAALFRCLLPEGPGAYVKQEVLTRIDRVRTNAKLEQRRRDIAYEMDAGELGKFLLCLEHQSSPDKFMISRELYYLSDNIATYLAEREPVPSIINLILYHGEPSPQPYPIHPEECFGWPEVAMQYLSFKFIFTDLNKYSDADLLKMGHCAILLLLLKHGRDGNFALSPEEYRPIFEETIAALGDHYIYSMLQYAESLSDEEAGKKTYQFIEEILISKTDTIMTYGERLQQQGIQKGILQVAKNMLHQLHMGIEVVQQATGLSRIELERIVQQS